ncbi:MAG: sulfotransferase domain-containing protein [Halioglobus sp.]|nr:sulfotransferase domain-containing protein [Halioglobus sp.]
MVNTAFSALVRRLLSDLAIEMVEFAMGYIPNFFLVGAPKCGTTSMFRWLCNHPSVGSSSLKEPHYFNSDMSNRSVVDWNLYLKTFSSCGKQQVAIGEASTWYLYSHVAITEIERRIDHPKYIVMTRDPADMAISLYDHNRRLLYEDKNTFAEAWQAQKAREGLTAVLANCPDPIYLQYFNACSLGSQLQRLISIVPTKRVLHVSLQDIKNNPELQCARVLQFLSLDDFGDYSFPRVNVARGVRSRHLQRFLASGHKLKKQFGIHKSLGLTKINDMPITGSAASLAGSELYQELHERFSEERRLLSFCVKQIGQ